MYQVDFLCVFLIKTFVNGYDSIESTNLTTTTILQNTSPKTTTLYRQTNFKKDEMRRDDSSMIFRSADGRRNKREKTKLFDWSWDDWCGLQPKEGTCDKQIIRYYYNMQLDRCSPFSYTGCGGNENNFFNITDCEKYCKGSSLMNIIDSNSQPNYCYLQPNPGLCLAMIQKYYYDINQRSCNKFTYGGCGGNQNKFDSKFSCMSTCHSVNKT